MRFPGIRSRRVLRVIGVGYLLAAVLFTALFLLARGLAPPTGLTRSFFPTLDPDAEPLFEERATVVDLSFVDERGDLPERFHRVRWQGVWYSPRPEVVDFHAGGDGRRHAVTVRVNGEVLLRRNPSVGMRTTSSAVTLDAGAHRLVIDYQQRGGGRYLNVQWAPPGGTPRPLSPSRLFVQDPGVPAYWLAVASLQLQYFVPLVWAAGPAAVSAALVVALLGLVGRWLRDGLRHWYRAALLTTPRDVRFRLYTLGFPALLLAGVPFLVGTHTIYASNLDEFALPFSQMAAPWLLAVVGVAWGLLMVPGALVSERFIRVYAAMLFALGLLLWAQGNLWVGDYGVLDGSEIDFDQLAWRVPYELAAWIVVPAVACAFYPSVSRIAPFASQLFLAVQVVAILAGQSAEGRVRWAEPPQEVYEFSSQQNVIFLVLDEFQSDVFTEIVERERPWLDERFSGFVYFADHVGAFPTTSLSMPAMLTGRTYYNARPVPEFVRSAFGDMSIFRGLGRHGYEIDVASILSQAWVDDWFPADGGESGPATVRMTIRKPYVGIDDYRRFTARQLIELSVLRHVPHLVREALARRPGWFTRVFWAESLGSLSAERLNEAGNSQAFFSQFIDRITVGRDRALFKLIHLGIPHRPVVLDEHCAFLGVTRFSREAYLGQSRCAVELVAAFLDRLRALGVYDQSLIIVASDHGTDLEPRGFAGESGSLPRRTGETTARLTAIAGTAMALMLIKPPGRDGPLVISRAPTVHTDVPATIFDLLGLPHAFEGLSMLKRDPTAVRRRTYGMYDVRQRFPEGYLDRLDLIAIERELLNGEGWIHERSILPPGLDLAAPTIDLGDGDARPHLGPGWSRGEIEEVDGREITFVWGLGRRAVAFASLPSGTTRLTARVSAAENRDKVIEVEVDGQWLGRATVSGERYQDVTLQVPPTQSVRE